jgi:DNA polymerase-3 subunit epsilon
MAADLPAVPASPFRHDRNTAAPGRRRTVPPVHTTGPGCPAGPSCPVAPLESGAVDHSSPEDLPAALHDAVADCVVIDCETTGLHPAEDRIIEVAAVAVRYGRVVDSFHSRVNPGQPLPQIITELTGLRDDDLATAPAAADILVPLSDFLDGHTVVGHNIAFDLSFLASESARTRAVTFRTPPHLCTADSARTLIPRSEVGRYRLTTLADRLDLPHRPSHRAAGDVLATLDLLNHLDGLAHHTPRP